MCRLTVLYIGVATSWLEPVNESVGMCQTNPWHWSLKRKRPLRAHLHCLGEERGRRERENSLDLRFAVIISNVNEILRFILAACLPTHGSDSVGIYYGFT